ncbi:phage tail tape measure protein [Pseudoalteromonas sp. MMG012]|uniref:phage tail tape measure protein n=1 Tax=Pseudoalteromonas sp. MMG012 TaxID=2822686 RepID=UPI001B3A2B71|nr:phage tail tape measure protein [Pseudoalteromonas sp. MMG012]MBQ4852688.1 phage tail tape measure protein [Pseudoalteromonas sp. MMG012]
MAVGKSLAVSIVIGAALAGSFKTVIGQSVNQFNRLGETVKQVESTSNAISGFKTVSEQLKTTRADIESARSKLQQYQTELKQSQAAHTQLAKSADNTAIATINAKNAYTKAQQKLARLKQTHSDAETKTEAMTAAIKAAKQEVQQTKVAFQQSETNLNKVNKSLAAAATEHQKLKNKVGAAHKELNKLSTRLGDSQRALNTHRKTMVANGITATQLSHKHTQLGQTLTTLKRKYADLQNAIQRHQAVMSKRDHYRNQMLDAAALGTAMLTPVAAAVKFESVMADVGKVVDFDTPLGLAQMGQDVLKLSTVIPMAADGIGDIVAAAGQAGIARKELLIFAQDAAKMGVAFDMSGREAGAAMTGMRSIFKLNQTQVVSLGDAYNHLSNKMDARAKDMLNIANRAGSTAKLFGLTAQQVGALGATFLELKTPPEVAATGINALLLKLKTADKQSKSFQRGLSTLGMSATELKKNIEEDAQGALISFLETLEKTDDVTGVLADMFGAEYADDMAKLVGGLDNYKKALSLVSKQGDYAGSMQKEFAVRSNTTANSLTLLKNQVNRLGVNIGSVLLPAVNWVAGSLGTVVDGIATVAHTFPVATKVVVGLAVGLAMIKVTSIAAGYASTFLAGGWIKAGIAVKTLSAMVTMGRFNLASFNTTAAATAATTNALGAGSGILAFGSKLGALKTGLVTFATVTLPAVAVGIKAMGAALLTTPIGWAVMAIAAGAVLVYKYWQPIKAFMGGLWDGFVSAIKPLTSSLTPVGKLLGWIGDGLGTVFNWVSNLFTPVNMVSDELAGFASAGQTVGAVFGGLVNIVTTPFRAALWFIEKTLSAFGKLGDTISSVGGWFGFGDDEEKKPSTSLVKPIALASTMAVTPAMASDLQADSATPNKPIMQQIQSAKSAAPGALTQQVKQQLAPVAQPTLPNVEGSALYKGRVEVGAVPTIKPNALTQPIVQQLQPAKSAEPGLFTQQVNQQLKPVAQPTLPNIEGSALYKGRVEVGDAPTIKTNALTQPVVQQLQPAKSAAPGSLTQQVKQQLEPVVQPTLPNVEGSALYKGRLEVGDAPTIKSNALTQPVVQQLQPAKSAAPGSLTQQVKQQLAPVAKPTLPNIEGSALYKGRVEVGDAPTIKTNALTQPVVQQLQPAQPAAPDSLTQQVKQQLEPVAKPTLPNVEGSALYKGRVEVGGVPTIKPNALTQPVVQQLQPVKPAVLGSLTQQVKRQFAPVTQPALSKVEGSALYKGRVEVDEVPTIKPNVLTQPVVQQLQPVKSAAPNALSQQIRQQLKPTAQHTLPKFKGSASFNAQVEPSEPQTPYLERLNRASKRNEREEPNKPDQHKIVEHHENHTWYVTINQQPGENEKALVDRIMREIDKRKAQSQRGKLYDV